MGSTQGLLMSTEQAQPCVQAILYGMSGVVRPPCAELLRVAEVIDEVVADYFVALRNAADVGRWEAPQEGFALGWLLIRNIEAVTGMARYDEVLVTAAWSNTRVAFEISARIIWILHPADRFDAECRWLTLLGGYEETERKLAREVPEQADRHSERADAIRSFREGVIAKLPNGYQPKKGLPSFRDLLVALDNRKCIRFIRKVQSTCTGACTLLAATARTLELNAALATSLIPSIGSCPCGFASFHSARLPSSFWIAWECRRQRCSAGRR